MPIRPAITARNGPKTSIRRATTCDLNRSGPAPNRTVFCGPESITTAAVFVTLRLSSASPGPEGEGSFAVGKRRATLGPGAVTWSTPGEPHGVANDSDGNLVLLVAVAPNPNR